jgi:hypothetical protein
MRALLSMQRIYWEIQYLDFLARQFVLFKFEVAWKIFSLKSNLFTSFVSF